MIPKPACVLLALDLSMDDEISNNQFMEPIHYLVTCCVSRSPSQLLIAQCNQCNIEKVLVALQITWNMAASLCS